MKENYYVVELSFDEFMDQVKYMAGEMVNDHTLCKSPGNDNNRRNICYLLVCYLFRKTIDF